MVSMWSITRYTQTTCGCGYALYPRSSRNVNGFWNNHACAIECFFVASQTRSTSTRAPPIKYLLFIELHRDERVSRGIRIKPSSDNPAAFRSPSFSIILKNSSFYLANVSSQQPSNTSSLSNWDNIKAVLSLLQLVLVFSISDQYYLVTITTTDGLTGAVLGACAWRGGQQLPKVVTKAAQEVRQLQTSGDRVQHPST